MKVLAIGAHPDDIELGCAGALLRHVAAGDEVTMLVMTPGEMGPQGLTSRVREQEAAAAVIGATLDLGPVRGRQRPLGPRRGLRGRRGRRPDRRRRHLRPRAATTPTRTTSRPRSPRWPPAAGLARVLFYQSPSTTVVQPDRLRRRRAHARRQARVAAGPLVAGHAVRDGRPRGGRGRCPLLGQPREDLLRRGVRDPPFRVGDRCGGVRQASARRDASLETQPGRRCAVGRDWAPAPRRPRS